MLTKKYNLVIKGVLNEISDNGDIEMIDKDSVDVLNIINELKLLKGNEITISFAKTDKIVSVPNV